MKRKLWGAFETAVADLHWNKGKLVSIAYEGNPSGIDYAIPQEDIDRNNLSHDETFWLVADCTMIGYRIVDLRDIIPDSMAGSIIRYADLSMRFLGLDDDGKELFGILDSLFTTYHD